MYAETENEEGEGYITNTVLALMPREDTVVDSLEIYLKNRGSI